VQGQAPHPGVVACEDGELVAVGAVEQTDGFVAAAGEQEQVFCGGGGRVGAWVLGELFYGVQRDLLFEFAF
jgi:hypothetical protein